MTTRRKALAIDREIVRLTAIKNHQNVEEAQKEHTKKMQREYRAWKLKKSRQKS
jgi:hypothetical protein